nr:hypothetical protein [uncultured Treponema sp.]
MEVSPDEPSYADCCIYLKDKTESAKFVDDRQEFDVFKKELNSIDSDTLVWIRFNEKDNL